MQSITNVCLYLHPLSITRNHHVYVLQVCDVAERVMASPVAELVKEINPVTFLVDTAVFIVPLIL